MLLNIFGACVLAVFADVLHVADRLGDCKALEAHEEVRLQSLRFFCQAAGNGLNDLMLFVMNESELILFVSILLDLSILNELNKNFTK